MISVIVPIYNAQTYLQRSVEAILNQSFQDFELVLVDDGSTDESGQMCDNYALKDNRIKVVHQQNKGASEARNTGIKSSSGDFLTFVDADDYVSVNYLERMNKDYEYSHHSDLIIQGMVLQKDSSEKIYTLKDSEYKMKFDTYNLFFDKTFLNDFSGPYCKLFRRKIISQYNILFSPKIIYAEDLDFLLRYIVHCNTIGTSSATNYHYIMHEGSVSRKFYTFLQEHEGLQQLKNSFDVLLFHYPSASLQKMMSVSMNAYLWRVIYSNYCNNYNIKQRVSNLKLFYQESITCFSKYFENRTIFTKILKFLFVSKQFNFFDVLLNSRINL